MFLVDDNGLVFSWSKQAEKFLGWTDVEAVNKLTLTDLIPDYEKFKEYLHLGAVPGTKLPYLEQDKTRTPRRLFVAKTEDTGVLTKDGKNLVVEIQIRAEKLTQVTRFIMIGFLHTSSTKKVQDASIEFF
jgi:PAS domain-containing protein